jgi:predicted RNA binding protein with dsRBD fold (UPF0201 family)
MEKHIEITRYLSVDGVTTYYVIEKKKNSSGIIWYGTNKQAAYQVAYRSAKKDNSPLYAIQYQSETDENGAKFIIPVGNERLTN